MQTFSLIVRYAVVGAIAAYLTYRSYPHANIYDIVLPSLPSNYDLVSCLYADGKSPHNRADLERFIENYSELNDAITLYQMKRNQHTKAVKSEKHIVIAVAFIYVILFTLGVDIAEKIICLSSFLIAAIISLLLTFHFSKGHSDLSIRPPLDLSSFMSDRYDLNGMNNYFDAEYRRIYHVVDNTSNSINKAIDDSNFFIFASFAFMVFIAFSA